VGQAHDSELAAGTAAAPREELTTARSLRVRRGAVYVFFAFDVAPYLDLADCERRVMSGADRRHLAKKRRALEYFEYRPSPLRIAVEANPIGVGRYTSLGSVDLVVYDFGAISLAYTIPFDGTLAELAELSVEIDRCEALSQAARRLVDSVSRTLEGGAGEFRVAEVVEDYVMFHVIEFDRPVSQAELCSSHAEAIAQILRAAESPLSAQEVEDTTSSRIGFTGSDLTVLDWNASLLYGDDVEDLRTVIEFANVQLLEMRFLDRQLDEALEESYAIVSQPRRQFRSILHSYRKGARRIARMQVDAAIHFERVTNALKVFGEEYLGRVYRLTAARLHLAAWDGSAIRKLGTLDSIYAKLSDEAAARRLEILEWIIVALIAVSIVLPFLT
jgi:hypothetical protein